MVDQSSLFSSGDNNKKDPTFKNLLLVQIRRLNKSTDPLDKQLLNYLISVIKDKGYLQESWIAEIEEVEQIHKLVKNGKSVSSAVDIVAKKSKRTKSTLQDQYAEFKNALAEIDQIFQESRTKDQE